MWNNIETISFILLFFLQIVETFEVSMWWCDNKAYENSTFYKVILVFPLQWKNLFVFLFICSLKM